MGHLRIAQFVSVLQKDKTEIALLCQVYRQLCWVRVATTIDQGVNGGYGSHLEKAQFSIIIFSIKLRRAQSVFFSLMISLSFFSSLSLSFPLKSLNFWNSLKEDFVSLISRVFLVVSMLVSSSLSILDLLVHFSSSTKSLSNGF